ncbi:MAG: amino acid ABC transporter substrate-binding protein [Candidatus Methylomirabilaceae bacterium]
MTYLMAALLALLAMASPAMGQELQGTLKKIKESGAMVIGYTENVRPFSFLGADGKPTGYSIDLCKRIAAAVQQELGLRDLELRYVPVTAQNRIKAVADGTIDIECGTSTNTLSRQEQVDFTNMTFVDGGSLLVTTASKISRIADLADKRVAVMSGTTTERALTEALKKSYVNAKVIAVKDHAEGVSALETGAVDAYASDNVILIGLALTAKNPGKLTLADQQFSYEPYGFMTRRGDAPFRLVANRALARLYRSGQIFELYDRWFGALGRPSGALLIMYLLNGLPD